MIRVAKIVVVDGAEVQVSAEHESPQTALLAVNAAASALGAAPEAPSSGKKPPNRRSKAEMDAARAAAAAPAIDRQDGGSPPALGAPPADGRVVGTDYAEPPASSVLPGPLPPPEPLRAFAPPADQVATHAAPAMWGPEPPVPQVGKQVAFDGPPPPLPDASPPPPPAMTVEEGLREQIDQTMKRTIDLKPEWRQSVIDAMHHAAGPLGGDIFKMAEAPLRDVLRAVETYEQRVRTTLGL